MLFLSLRLLFFLYSSSSSPFLYSFLSSSSSILPSSSFLSYFSLPLPNCSPSSFLFSFLLSIIPSSSTFLLFSSPSYPLPPPLLYCCPLLLPRSSFFFIIFLPLFLLFFFLILLSLLLFLFFPFFFLLLSTRPFSHFSTKEILNRYKSEYFMMSYNLIRETNHAEVFRWCHLYILLFLWLQGPCLWFLQPLNAGNICLSLFCHIRQKISTKCKKEKSKSNMSGQKC